MTKYKQKGAGSENVEGFLVKLFKDSFVFPFSFQYLILMRTLPSEERSSEKNLSTPPSSIYILLMRKLILNFSRLSLNKSREDTDISKEKNPSDLRKKSNNHEEKNTHLKY